MCLLAYGIPITLIGMEEWGLGFLGTAAFLLTYMLTTTAKTLRKSIKILDPFVFLSYIINFTGCWLVAFKGYDDSVSIWIYVAVFIMGFPVFKQVQRHFEQELN
ncbi:hypothetical protein BGP78_02050 [Pseudoalteromonas sp. MSK9-3]|nr:hypothetical protein BGP78_02050 [Pseudoalteromonas sp. MSK9-3]